MIFIFSLLVPNAASARNNDVPFYNGTPDTELTSRQLQIPGKLLRPGKGYTPPGSENIYYTADVHYPALYNGAFNFGNHHENLIKTLNLQSLLLI